MKKHKIAIFVLLLIMALIGYGAVLRVYADDNVTIGAAPCEGENIYEELLMYASDDDILQLERVVYWEAARANCPLDTCVAVVETVLNRVLSDDWPDTIAGVCTDKRYGRQFVCKYYIPEYAWQDELVSDAIEYVLENGPTQLPNTNYVFFATKMQSKAKNHIWIGKRKANGKPDKGINYCHGMYFGEAKE